ncbi:MAG TPA: PQQ-dependent sugar dehydrogenase, partial [Abditibacteriaceae bacterium]
MKISRFARFCVLIPVAVTGCTRGDAARDSQQSAITAETDAVRLAANSPAQNRKTGATTAASPVSSSRIVRREIVPNGVKDSSGVTVPRGFAVNVFASGLAVPRRLAIAPGSTAGKYDLFVTESRSNRMRILRESNGDGKADSRFVFTQRTSQPYGLAFHPSGYLYVANTDSVVRFPYRNGATSANARPQFITKLTEGGYNQHWTRNLLFSRDFKKLFVTVGSSCNTCEEDDPQRAAISVMNPDGKARRVFASGLRNPVGMALRPRTDELWTVVNERDNIGDDLPPDYLTLVRDGAFYGWPYAYTDIAGRVSPDPSFGDKRPDKVRATRPPTVPVQAHSAALGVVFYPTGQKAARGVKPFPAAYEGDAFLAFHGSWNRSAKTGYKIVRVDFRNGRPAELTDFVRGYLRGNGRVWGRPVDVVVAPDGSLLFSDDGSGTIWRVSY